MDTPKDCSDCSQGCRCAIILLAHFGLLGSWNWDRRRVQEDSSNRIETIIILRDQISKPTQSHENSLNNTITSILPDSVKRVYPAYHEDVEPTVAYRLNPKKAGRVRLFLKSPRDTRLRIFANQYSEVRIIPAVVRILVQFALLGSECCASTSSNRSID